MRIRYLLAGQDVNPVNRKEIYLEINHDQGAIINQPAPHVGIKNLYFAREDVRKIIQQLASSPGITEGVPFDIVFTEGSESEVLNMYLNLMDGFKVSKNGIETSVIMLQSLDYIDKKAESFTLESMYNELGVMPFQIDGITYTSYQDYFDKRCIFIPYVISAIPNYQNVFMSTFSVIYIGIELYKVVKQIIQWSSPIAGLGVVLPVLQLIAELVFALLLIATLIAMIIQVVNCLIQDVKYHGAMLMVDMLKIVAQKMGLKFQSSIWESYPWNQVAYLPEKYNPIEDANPLGFNIMGIPVNGFAKRGFTTPGYAPPTTHDSTNTTIQKGYLNGLGADVLRIAKTPINGKIIIPDGSTTLLMERRDYYPADTPFQLPNIRQDWNGYNTDELSATIEIRFTDDLNDKNCIDKYVGTILQATTQQITINDIRKVGLQGLRVVNINAARGIAKTTLNFIEKAIADLNNIWDIIWKAFVIPLDIIIAAINVYIAYLNVLIYLWNFLMYVIGVIISAIADIYNLINSLLGGSNPVPNINTNGLLITPLQYIPFYSFTSPDFLIFTDRINALLLENDMVSTPKLLMVDVGRPDFYAPQSGSPSGQKRIAYLHPDNNAVINAQYLWDNFYFIDQFTNDLPNNNRYTKISPATNHEGDKNPITIKLKDFKKLVANPKFKDNFGEEVVMESAQWYCEQNGRTTLDFRKKGWLIDPQNLNGLKRSQEININLRLKTSLPNGQ